VDDDVVDPAVLFEVGQHLLQLRPVSGAGRLTAVGKLLDHQRPHRLCLALVGLPLGWQGEAFLQPTTLGLLTSRDADVGDGALGGELGGHGRKRVSPNYRYTALC